MMTEQEQMDRFEAAVTELLALQRKQMHRHMDKGGWDELDMERLLNEASEQTGLAWWAYEDDELSQLREYLVAAANYLVLAFDRIREEGGA